MQIHIWEQNDIVWMNLGAQTYYRAKKSQSNGLRCKNIFDSKRGVSNFKGIMLCMKSLNAYMRLENIDLSDLKIHLQ